MLTIRHGVPYRGMWSTQGRRQHPLVHKSRDAQQRAGQGAARRARHHQHGAGDDRGGHQPLQKRRAGQRERQTDDRGVEKRVSHAIRDDGADQEPQ